MLFVPETGKIMTINCLKYSDVRKTENRFGFGFQKTEPNRTEAKFQNRHVGFPKFPRVCPKPKERRR